MNNFFNLLRTSQSGELSLRPLYECIGLDPLGLFTDTGTHLLLLQILRIKIRTRNLFSDVSLSCYGHLVQPYGEQAEPGNLCYSWVFSNQGLSGAEL